MRLVLLGMLVFATACAEAPGGSLGGADAGRRSDDSGAGFDAGRPDLGAPDSGADAGTVDAQSPDAGRVECRQLSEAECANEPGCENGYCPGLCGNDTYLGCFGPNDPWPSCPPPPDCPCDRLDEQECAANAFRCHAVYFDPANCLCDAPGCCAQFERCTAPAQAQCQPGIVLCEAAPPYCEGPYVVAYENDCYEGCVLQSVCR